MDPNLPPTMPGLPPQPPTIPPQPPAPVAMHSKNEGKKILLLALVAVFLAVAGVGTWLYVQHYQPKQHQTGTTVPMTTKPKTTETVKTQGVTLDSKKSYGNKYADGLLPVGDGRYSASEAKKDSVYACSSYATNLNNSQGQGGASTRGPWFTNNNTEYDVTKKAHVQGNILWHASFSNTISGNTRTITTNGLPGHPTGIFPIAMADPAYAYDRNPNTITEQSFTYSLASQPVYGEPTCMGGEVGVMLTGIPLFNAFDAGGRDAGAWEVQDSCDGHPQKQGEYHYHTLSSCIKDTSVQTVIGFALDGFPITGPKVSANNILTTDNLDECHGLASQIILDNKPVTTYHYVMTQDFPYSVSCFRATAAKPPGQPQGQP